MGSCKNVAPVQPPDCRRKKALSGSECEHARIRVMRERFDQLSNRVAEAYVDVPADQGMAEIDATIAQERRG